MSLLPPPILFQPGYDNPGPSSIKIIWPFSANGSFNLEIQHIGKTKIIEVNEQPYQIKSLFANRMIKVRCFMQNGNQIEWSDFLEVNTKLPTPQPLSFVHSKVILDENVALLSWNVSVPQTNSSDKFKVQIAQTDSQESAEHVIIGDFETLRGEKQVELKNKINFFWIRLITDTPIFNISKWAEPIYFGRVTYFQGNQSNSDFQSSSRINSIKRLKSTYKGNI